MINIIKYPNSEFAGAKKPQVFARNDVSFKLEGTNYQTTAAIKSTNYIIFANTGISDIADGETVRLQWNGNDITFIFRDSATGINEIQNNDSFDYADQAELMIGIRNKMSKYYQLYRDFEMVISGEVGVTPYRLTFVPRNIGNQYTITFTSSTANISTASSDGQLPVFGSNYSIRVEVLVELTLYAGDFIIPEGSEKNLIPGADERVLFSVHDVIRPYLDDDIPVLSPVAIRTNTKSVKRFMVRACERTVAGSVISNGPYEGIPGLFRNFIAVNGAVSRDREHTIDWREYDVAADAKFLTNIPRNVLIHKEQPIFLTAYKNDAADQKVNLILYYDDNSTEDIDTLLTAHPGNNYFVNIPAGYTQLGIDGLKNPAKTVVAYDLKYARQATASDSQLIYTETIQFEVNQDYFPENHFFLFRNTYGFWDSVWCAGDTMEKAEVSHDSIERKVDNTSPTNAVLNELRKVNPEINNVQRYETNYRKADYIRYLKELLATERIFKVQNNKLYEGVLLTDSADLPNSSEFEDTFVFDFAFGKEVGI